MKSFIFLPYSCCPGACPAAPWRCVRGERSDWCTAGTSACSYPDSPPSSPRHLSAAVADHLAPWSATETRPSWPPAAVVTLSGYSPTIHTITELYTQREETTIFSDASSFCCCSWSSRTMIRDWDSAILASCCCSNSVWLLTYNTHNHRVIYTERRNRHLLRVIFLLL